MTADNYVSAANEPQFVLERSFSAPRELVFRCWTEPEHFKQWWGPSGYTTPECSIDLRVGGRIHFCMRSPEGQDYWGGGVYSEINPPQRLAFTDYFADAQGNKVDPGAYGMPEEWPDEARTVVTFEERDGQTHMTLTQDVPLRIAKLVMADQGWGQSFDRLAGYLAKI